MFVLCFHQSTCRMWVLWGLCSSPSCCLYCLVSLYNKPLSCSCSSSSSTSPPSHVSSFVECVSVFWAFLSFNSFCWCVSTYSHLWHVRSFVSHVRSFVAPCLCVLSILVVFCAVLCLCTKPHSCSCSSNSRSLPSHVSSFVVYVLINASEPERVISTIYYV